MSSNIDKKQIADELKNELSGILTRLFEDNPDQGDLEILIKPSLKLPNVASSGFYSDGGRSISLSVKGLPWGDLKGSVVRDNETQGWVFKSLDF